MAERILLDVTRTISRAGLGADTGVDRVERAWIDWAFSPRWASAQFIARASGGVFAVDAEGMREVLATLGGAPARLDLRAGLRRAKRPEVRRAESVLRRNAVPVRSGAAYFNVGHSNLTPASIAEIRRYGATRVVVKLHDVIPLDHPEYAREDGPEKMRARLDAAEAADGVIFNSAFTRERAFARMNVRPPSAVAPLGVEVVALEAPPHGGFVVLGTIEPRKNHALLLDIWGTNAAARAHTLHIVGRRGWMNEPVFRRLDAGIEGVVETGDADDAAAMRLLAGARALLFPSFVEGYGLPLAEALALGAPAIASDIPALREVGGDAATYLPPDDPDAWLEAILRHCEAAPNPEMEARRAAWRAPTWADHFAEADGLLARVAT